MVEFPRIPVGARQRRVKQSSSGGGLCASGAFKSSRPDQTSLNNKAAHLKGWAAFLFLVSLPTGFIYPTAGDGLPMIY